MNHLGTFTLAICAAMGFSPMSASEVIDANTRKGPSPEQHRLVDELLASQHPYQCCQDTIAGCIRQAPVCPLARRLERAVRDMVAAGHSRVEVEHALAARKTTMASSAPRARVAIDQRFGTGEPSASVVLALYACGRSEPCAKLIPSLYYEVNSGRLKGKVRMYYRPFYPDDKEDAAACGRTLVAAAGQGEFWPYLLHLYHQRENFQLCMLRKWADIKGLDFDAFGLALDHPDTTALLAAARQEGLENDVDSVPSAFINGRKVQGDLSSEMLVDLLEEEHERVTTLAPADAPKVRN